MFFLFLCISCDILLNTGHLKKITIYPSVFTAAHCVFSAAAHIREDLHWCVRRLSLGISLRWTFLCVFLSTGPVWGCVPLSPPYMWLFLHVLIFQTFPLASSQDLRHFCCSTRNFLPRHLHVRSLTTAILLFFKYWSSVFQVYREGIWFYIYTRTPIPFHILFPI